MLEICEYSSIMQIRAVGTGGLFAYTTDYVVNHGELWPIYLKKECAC